MFFLIIRERTVVMSMAEELKNYLKDISDIPEQYQSGFQLASAMVNLEKLSERLSDESFKELFPFIRKTLLAAAMWANTFAENAAISEMELLKRGLGCGLFALKCTGTRNFSFVEWQIKKGIREFIRRMENNGKMPKIKIKFVSCKPVKCPFCGSEDMKEIIYGLPSPDFDYSRYISGGCCARPLQWHCDNCFAKFSLLHSPFTKSEILRNKKAVEQLTGRKDFIWE